jgi:hypothetical protein
MNFSTANKVAVFINFVFLDLTYNVGKTIINHPPNLHFSRWYGFHSQSWVAKMALFYPHE